VVALLCLLAVYVPVAGASSEWCEDDPALVVKTLTGTKVTLHVTTYGQLSGNSNKDLKIRKAVAATSFGYVSDPASPDAPTAATVNGVAGTWITVYVLVPTAGGQSFPTYSIIGTGPHGKGEIGRVPSDDPNTAGIESAPSGETHFARVFVANR
jgi:hypothetical protein